VNKLASVIKITIGLIKSDLSDVKAQILKKASMIPKYQASANEKA
jgi:hypothetical protein